MSQHITIFALGEISNIGETFLADCTRWLLRTSGAGEVVVEELKPSTFQLAEKLRSRRRARFLLWLSQRVYNCRYLFPHQYWYLFRSLAYNALYRAYFKKCLEDSKGVVYAVGMLKFATQDFSYIFDLINTIAGKRKIPVMMSAMSVARPDLKDWRYHQLVRAVNRSSVKVITTRDGEGGVDRLCDYYLRKDNHVEVQSVADVAFWIPEVYGIRRRNQPIAHRVGINLPRLGLFADYDGGVDDETLLRFYEELIRGLDEEGCEWRLFSNGIAADERFGRILLQRMRISEDVMLPKAQGAKEYLSRLNEFSVVFTARFHACLSCFVLGIPFLGLLWDDKLRLFARQFDVADRFLDGGQLDGKTVARKLLLLRPCNFVSSNLMLRTKTRDSIRRFVTGCAGA